MPQTLIDKDIIEDLRSASTLEQRLSGTTAALVTPASQQTKPTAVNRHTHVHQNLIRKSIAR